MKRFKKGLNVVLLASSLILLAVSLAFPQKEVDVAKEAVELGRSIDRRLDKLDKCARELLNKDAEELFTAKGLPEDFSFYLYENQHLVAWWGQLPVQYDEYVGGSRRTTLSSVGEEFKYYYFSGTSFLMRSYESDKRILIAALRLNPNEHIRIQEGFTLLPMSMKDGNVINVQGKPTIKLFFDSLPVKSPLPAHLAWISYLLFMASLLLSLSFRPNLKNALGTILLLLFVVFVAYRCYPVLKGELTQIISILLISIIVFEIATSLYLVRRDIWRNWTKRYQIIIGIALDLLFVLFLIWFCYISIYKVLVYTHINLHLYKLWALSLDTLVVYAAIFAIFFSIAELLDLLQPLWIRIFKRRLAIFSVSGVFIYSLLCSIFCVFSSTFIGFQRESIVVSSWAESLANARDYELETHLRRVERQISRDEVLARASESDEAFAAAKSRLVDRYFLKYMNAYDLTLKVGRNESIIGLDEGVQIETGSRFRFAPISDQRRRYVAAFHYYSFEDGQKSIYIILEPKYPNKRSLSTMLSDDTASEVPGRYSYAMYKEGYRQYMKGNYAYPLKLGDELYAHILSGKEYIDSDNGYISFYTTVGEDEVIVMSRGQISVGILLINTVFISLVFSIFLFLMVRRKKRRINFEKSYFKRSMIYVVIFSLVMATSILAFVSVGFVNERSNSSVNWMMSDKVNSIRFQLQNGIRALEHPEELNSREMLELLRMVGDNTGSDISLYRPDGKVVMSTIPEIHERHIMGYRMPQTPYYHLRYENEGYCINKETLGNRSIYMLYAPIVRANGDLLAFFASPYTDGGGNFIFDAVLHTVSVLVVFIILLIISSIGVTVAIDKTFKPLSEMSRKMRSGRLEKLSESGYRDDAEIKDIVTSYNRMVDDLSNSTKALAQAERDKAWSEMARNVAHEIKNPLTPMQLQIQRVQRLKAMGDESWKEKFDSMAEVLLDHIKVLTETANQFSDFAKLYSEEPVEVPLDNLLREEVSLFDNRPDVEFVYMGLPDVIVKAPRPQLVRVFVNLLNNAVQACEGVPDARIEVSLRNGSDPDFYEIVFEDNGAGVEEANISKLFTPKFTTKSSGSGLGLSICKSILEKCGASISYSRSFRLGGACFTILYPKS